MKYRPMPPVRAVTLGTVFIDDMRLKYDASGAVVLELRDGSKQTMLPDFTDMNMLVTASALGYGRQIGLMGFHTVVLHCLLASSVGTEPTWLTQPQQAPQIVERVTHLLLLLNNQRTGMQPSDDDAQVLEMARYLLQGGHYGGQS
jgi:hypothetical protein